MNQVHLHLLLNHIPTVGFGVGLFLFLISLVRKDGALQQLSLGILYLVALVSIPLYVTGVAAGEMIEKLPGVSKALIQAHGDAALSAFIVMEITGAVAWLALWQVRRFARLSRGLLSTLLLLSMVSFGLMARAANLGGEIRHPEIRPLQQTATNEEAEKSTDWLTNASVKSFVIDNSWVWPACETVHFIGLGLSFGIVLLLNLRMLGMLKSVAFADLHRMLPWGLLGFVLNFVTGMLFFIGIPEQYTNNVAFAWKLLFLVLVGANLLYFTSFDEAWDVGPDVDAPLTAKAIAASTIFLWAGVLYFGRMLPYLGAAF
jgi:hypothetical protein